MAKEHCAECGAMVDEDELVYNEYVGLDVCSDCDDALSAQESYEVAHGAQFPPNSDAE